jgi:hypothetical protein
MLPIEEMIIVTALPQILLSILFSKALKNSCTDQVPVTFRLGKQVKVFVHKHKLMTAEVDDGRLFRLTSAAYFISNFTM